MWALSSNATAQVDGVIQRVNREQLNVRNVTKTPQPGVLIIYFPEPQFPQRTNYVSLIRARRSFSVVPRGVMPPPSRGYRPMPRRIYTQGFTQNVLGYRFSTRWMYLGN